MEKFNVRKKGQEGPTQKEVDLMEYSWGISVQVNGFDALTLCHDRKAIIHKTNLTIHQGFEVEIQ